MQIVIEISDYDKEWITNGYYIPKEINVRISEAIENGTPLPKGHGRLIAEPTEKEIARTIGGNNGFAECIREAVKMVFDNAKTIIPADKEDLGVCKYAPYGYDIDKCPYQKKGCKKQCVQSQEISAKQLLNLIPPVISADKEMIK